MPPLFVIVSGRPVVCLLHIISLRLPATMAVKQEKEKKGELTTPR